MRLSTSFNYPSFISLSPSPLLPSLRLFLPFHSPISPLPSSVARLPYPTILPSRTARKWRQVRDNRGEHIVVTCYSVLQHVLVSEPMRSRAGGPLAHTPGIQGASGTQVHKGLQGHALVGNEWKPSGGERDLGPPVGIWGDWGTCKLRTSGTKWESGSWDQ